MTRVENLYVHIRAYINICCHETQYNENIPLLCMALLEERELSLAQSMMFYYFLTVLEQPATNNGSASRISHPVVTGLPPSNFTGKHINIYASLRCYLKHGLVYRT